MSEQMIYRLVKGSALTWQEGDNNFFNSTHFTQNGSGAVERTTWGKMKDLISVKDFGVVGDGIANDTVALQTALSSLVAGQSLFFPHGTYNFNGCLTLRTSNVGLHFDNCTFLVGDTGTPGTVNFGGTGQIGLLIQDADNLQITGSVRFLGQGTVGMTSLAGVIFDTCSNVLCSAHMYFNTMAAGRFFLSCTESVFGNVSADLMDGRQTFESPPTNTAGSVEVFVGCTSVVSGTCLSINGRKPGRYMSVGPSSGNNTGCAVGDSVYNGNSIEGQALAIRSAVDCSFGSVVSIGGGAHSLFIGQYDGDQALGFRIERVSVDSVLGLVGATGSSVDSLIFAESEDVSEIGLVQIGRVSGNVSGEFGIYNTGVKLHIGSIELTGPATRLLAVYALKNGFAPELHTDYLKIYNNTGLEEPITIGKGARFTARHVDVLSGPENAAVSVAIFYNSALGLGNIPTVDIGSIYYRQNGSTYNYAYLLYFPESSFVNNPIFHIDGTGSVGQACFDVDVFFVKQGMLLSTGPATTTTATYTQGAIIWNSGVTAAGIPGWVCTVTGSPGTWKAMAIVAA